MEKQTYALIKSLKDFRVYILHSHIIAYVPNNVIKNILTQLDPEGKIEKWIVVLLEYDLDIKPTKLIKGQGLAKLLTDANYESLKINFMSNVSSGSNSGLQVIKYFSLSPWYSDIVYVLQNLQSPPGLSKNRARAVKLKASKFCLQLLSKSDPPQTP